MRTWLFKIRIFEKSVKSKTRGFNWQIYKTGTAHAFFNDSSLHDAPSRVDSLDMFIRTLWISMNGSEQANKAAI
jgi:hypothetical protein